MIECSIRRKTYVHELLEWPALTWNAAALTESLTAARRKQGRHWGSIYIRMNRYLPSLLVTRANGGVINKHATKQQLMPINNVRPKV